MSDDDDARSAPSLGEITMDAYVDDMREVLTQAETDGLVDISPSDVSQ